MRYPLGDLGFDWPADPKRGELTFSEWNKRGYRVIGGDKGDVHFIGYDTDGATTILHGVEFVGLEDLTEEEARQYAEDVVQEAHASIGSECVEH